MGSQDFNVLCSLPVIKNPFMLLNTPLLASAKTVQLKWDYLYSKNANKGSNIYENQC